ncbi:MAG: hypothetical protein CMP20_02615 [Rickettsiales bacterium]|nr:hypothetical protein [Rickettsiales bacterium]
MSGSGIGYGSNTNAPIVEAGLHTINARKERLPASHAQSPYPTLGDSLDVHKSVYEGTIAFRDASNRRKSIRGTMAVSTDLAGRFADAGSFEEVEKRTVPVGIVRRDAHNTAQGGDELVAVVPRGQISIYNTGGRSIHAGQKIRAKVPVSDSGIQSFRNNPQDPALIPSPALQQLQGMPAGKIHLQTVAVNPSDSLSVDAVAGYKKNASRAAKLIGKGLEINDSALLTAALVELEAAQHITINNLPGPAMPAPGPNQRSSDAFVGRVKAIRKGIRESNGPLSIGGKSALIAAQEAKWGKARALYLRKKRHHNNPEKQKLTNDQISTGPRILSHIAKGIRALDDDVIGMALEDARPGELFAASVDFTK